MYKTFRLGSFNWLFPQPGTGRQERAKKVPRFQLPINDEGQAVHLHHAHETGRRVEPNPVQLVRFHQARLRDQLHRDFEGPGSCVELNQ